ACAHRSIVPGREPSCAMSEGEARHVENIARAGLEAKALARAAKISGGLYVFGIDRGTVEAFMAQRGFRGPRASHRARLGLVISGSSRPSGCRTIIRHGSRGRNAFPPPDSRDHASDCSSKDSWSMGVRDPS